MQINKINILDYKNQKKKIMNLVKKVNQILPEYKFDLHRKRFINTYFLSFQINLNGKQTLIEINEDYFMGSITFSTLQELVRDQMGESEDLIAFEHDLVDGKATWMDWKHKNKKFKTAPMEQLDTSINHAEHTTA